MMKTVMSLLTGALLIGSAAPVFSAYDNNSSSAYNPSVNSSNQINWTTSYQDAVNQAQMSSKPILLLFTGTSWCPACMKLEKEVLRKPEFARAVGDKFVFVKAEFPEYSQPGMSRSSFKPLLDQYGVDSFPSIIVIDVNGRRLFNVEYRAGGPDLYSRELTQKLGAYNQSQRQNVNQRPFSNPTFNQGQTPNQNPTFNQGQVQNQNLSQPYIQKQMPNQTSNQIQISDQNLNQDDIRSQGPGRSYIEKQTAPYYYDPQLYNQNQ